MPLIRPESAVESDRIATLSGDATTAIPTETPTGVVAPKKTTAGISVAAMASLGLPACGDGGSPPVAGPTPAPTPTPVPPTSSEAARFLGQASLAATEDEINAVVSSDYESWLDQQFETPGNGSRWDWLMANGYFDETYRNGVNGADQSIWYKAITSPDGVRQRVTLALSEIFVIGQSNINGAGGWKGFGVAEYMDLLERHAFGNYRELLGEVTLSHQMGCFLSMRNSKKANAAGRAPDENYAREVLQLFSIGLYELSVDGEIARDAQNNPIETYNSDDIAGLARAFTGWNTNNYDAAVPDHWQRPMRFIPDNHEPGEKKFLGLTIAPGTDGEQAMQLALDRIASHSNVGPFISKQLIQRLVTSNPSPAYVQRVATVFNDDGLGERGNLKAVIKAILLDSEARAAVEPQDNTSGKLREPMLRFLQWARTFKAVDASGEWNIHSLSNSATALGQSPLRSPSVFNFFRPGFVPPNTALGNLNKVAPEIQITSETTVIGYANFMQSVIRNGRNNVKADYSTELALADDPQALVDRVQLLLAANQLSATTVATIVNAIESMPSTTDEHKRRRVEATVLLVMISPDYLVQK